MAAVIGLTEARARVGLGAMPWVAPDWKPAGGGAGGPGGVALCGGWVEERWSDSVCVAGGHWCRGLILFHEGALQARCSECGAWCGWMVARYIGPGVGSDGWS